ncbi:MAG: CHAT domain-containing protein [Pseudomonadota bacterium]
MAKTNATGCLSRRDLLVSATAAAATAPLGAFAQSDPIARINALAGQLEAASRRGDQFEFIKLRQQLAIELEGPFFGQTDEDRQHARGLFEANTAAAVRQISEGAWGLAHFHLAKFDLDDHRAQRIAKLDTIRHSLDSAFVVFGKNTVLNFEIARHAFDAAALADDAKSAELWRNAALTALPQQQPPRALRGDLNTQALNRDRRRAFFESCAFLSAKLGNFAEAWAYIEAARLYADAAVATPAFNRVPNTSKALRQAIDSLTYFDAVVAVAVAPAGAVALIAKRGANEPEFLNLYLAQADGQALDDKIVEQIRYGTLWRETFMRGQIGGWEGAYAADDGRGWISMSETFHRALPKIGERLWHRYAASLAHALESAGVQPGARVAMLLPDDLATVPIQLAADSKGAHPFAESYAVSHSPSTAILAAAVRSRPSTQRRLVGMYNPTGDLPGAESERALVTGHFADGAATEIGKGKSGPAFLKALRVSESGYYYLATHGLFGWTSANESGLALGERQSLKADAIRKLRGKLNARLMVLSACESGKSSEQLTIEPSNIPNLLLAKGVRGIIASLWKVSDTATSLMMAETLRLHLDDGLEPVQALQRARLWLRTSTALRFIDYLIEQMDTLADADIEPVELLTARLSEMPEDSVPFSHPYYWAAFAYYGA